MKKYIVIFILTAGIVSCGGKKKADGLALASEVCECRQKGKGLKFSDPEAKKIRMECSKLQGENWGKIIKDKTQEDAFNKKLNECTAEMIDAMNTQ
ncbi:MAG: hypothetical protein IPP99_10775 [Chitinophagaceae bacterium]|mgnify:FL=1|jgi:hypothetical protein|nr:hypothetical protein [Chitinophagaceae bacterium]MBP6589883.1 hypothetical protein [Chitinophagaceae bacterium]